MHVARRSWKYSLTPVATLTGLLLAGACDKEPKQPVDERTEPWPAPAASTRGSAQKRVQHDYVLASKQKLSFRLKTRSNSIEGEFPLVKGSLSVDLMNLKHSEAKLSIDLTAVRIAAEAERENRDYSMRAQNWLNLGSSQPEAVRARRRWATFLVEEIRTTQVDAAHEARVDKKLTRAAQAPPVADAGADAESPDATDPNSTDDGDTSLPIEEVRVARADLVGSLTLNQRKVTQPYSVRLQFHYPAKATPGVPPSRIVVETRRAIRIPLSQHDIEPRNAEGQLLSQDLKLLGDQVGSVAQVSFSLVFLDKSEARATAP